VKQVKFERLKWAGFVVRKDNTRMSKKRDHWNISWKKISGKTTAETGRQQQKGLLDAVEYNTVEETSMEHGYLVANY
jgi:hypothetical protein